MAEMKRLNGYEIVDDQARLDLIIAKTTADEAIKRAGILLDVTEINKVNTDILISDGLKEKVSSVLDALNFDKTLNVALKTDYRKYVYSSHTSLRYSGSSWTLTFTLPVEAHISDGETSSLTETQYVFYRNSLDGKIYGKLVTTLTHLITTSPSPSATIYTANITEVETLMDDVTAETLSKIDGETCSICLITTDYSDSDISKWKSSKEYIASSTKVSGTLTLQTALKPIEGTDTWGYDVYTFRSEYIAGDMPQYCWYGKKETVIVK